MVDTAGCERWAHTPGSYRRVYSFIKPIITAVLTQRLVKHHAAVFQLTQETRLIDWNQAAAPFKDIIPFLFTDANDVFWGLQGNKYKVTEFRGVKWFRSRNGLKPTPCGFERIRARGNKVDRVNFWRTLWRVKSVSSRRLAARRNDKLRREGENK